MHEADGCGVPLRAPKSQKLIMEHYALVRSTNEAASERECQALADATVQHVL